jgi:hypothetical protein
MDHGDVSSAGFEALRLSIHAAFSLRRADMLYRLRQFHDCDESEGLHWICSRMHLLGGQLSRLVASTGRPLRWAECSPSALGLSRTHG